MNDNIIKNKIKYYLDKNSFFDFSKVKILVHDGDVTLIGKVATKKEKHFAETTIKGMREINRMTSKLELISEATTLKLPSLQSILSQA